MAVAWQFAAIAIVVKAAGEFEISGSGRPGGVVDLAENLPKPRRKVFFSTTAGVHVAPQFVDLQKTGDEIESIENPERYAIDLARIPG